MAGRLRVRWKYTAVPYAQFANNLDSARWRTILSGLPLDHQCYVLCGSRAARLGAFVPPPEYCPEEQELTYGPHPIAWSQVILEECEEGRGKTGEGLLCSRFFPLISLTQSIESSATSWLRPCQEH